MDLVDNVIVRAAVANFADAPSEVTYRNVARECLHGDLLVDATGSDIRISDDGTSMLKGSLLVFHEGTGRDGRRALFAFTNQEQAQKMHADTRAITVGQPAVGLIKFAMKQDYSWLCIDPAGPTCSIGIADFDLALRAPRNDDVKSAIAETDPAVRRVRVLKALAEGGVLLSAARKTSPGHMQVRTTEGADGKPLALAFTSSLEIAARYDTYEFVATPVEDALKAAITGRLKGLVINAAGPSIELGVGEIEGVLRTISGADR